MKNIKFSYKYIIFMILMVISVFLSFFIISLINNPMRRPRSMIQNHILRHTPIGMHIDEAIIIIQNNEQWGVPSIQREQGFRHPEPWIHGERGTLIIGDMSIAFHTINIISYFERIVRISWGFDENGKLNEVHVLSTFILRLASEIPNNGSY